MGGTEAIFTHTNTHTGEIINMIDCKYAVNKKSYGVKSVLLSILFFSDGFYYLMYTVQLNKSFSICK